MRGRMLVAAGLCAVAAFLPFLSDASAATFYDLNAESQQPLVWAPLMGYGNVDYSGPQELSSACVPSPTTPVVSGTAPGYCDPCYWRDSGSAGPASQYARCTALGNGLYQPYPIAGSSTTYTMPDSSTQTAHTPNNWVDTQRADNAMYYSCNSFDHCGAPVILSQDVTNDVVAKMAHSEMTFCIWGTWAGLFGAGWGNDDAYTKTLFDFYDTTTGALVFSLTSPESNNFASGGYINSGSLSTSVSWPASTTSTTTDWHLYCVSTYNFYLGTDRQTSYAAYIDGNAVGNVATADPNWSDHFVFRPSAGAQMLVWGLYISDNPTNQTALMNNEVSAPLPSGGSTGCAAGQIQGPLSHQCKAGITAPVLTWTPLVTQTCASTANWWDVGADVTNAICNATNLVLGGVDLAASTVFTLISTVAGWMAFAVNAGFDLVEPSAQVFSPVHGAIVALLDKSPFKEFKDFVAIMTLGLGAPATTAAISMGNWGWGTWSVDMGTSVFAHLSPYALPINGAVYLATAFSMLALAKEAIGYNDN